MISTRTCLIAMLASIAAGACAQPQAAEPPSREALWRRLEAFTQPPADFAGQLGAYRSPLQFADGTIA
ncbi:MAG TPA: hypothetical protein VGX76_01110, partial [Pirellulales bacterium]|nr:hypothetical protein [Pirellulales bacterium]